jgi:tetratricopeptide (TPR) repeat protein
MADMFRMIYYTGLRRNEARALSWEDVQLTHKIIILPASNTKSKTRQIIRLTNDACALLAGGEKISDTAGQTTLNALVGTRIDSLSLKERTAIEVLAVSGEVSYSAIIARVLKNEKAATLSELERSGLISVNKDTGRISFLSPYVFETALSRMLKKRFIELCGLLNDAVIAYIISGKHNDWLLFNMLSRYAEGAELADMAFISSVVAGELLVQKQPRQAMELLLRGEKHLKNLHLENGKLPSGKHFDSLCRGSFHQGMSSETAHYHINIILAGINLILGNKNNAFHYGKVALGFAGSNKDKASALNIMAVVLDGAGHSVFALSLYERSLSLLDGQDTAMVLQVSTNIGILHSDSGRTDEALKIFRSVEHIALENPLWQASAELFSSIGYVERENGRYIEALL